MTSQPAIPPLAVIYQCPECETSYAGERRCPDCHLFCRKTGTGGLCPNCDEPVTLADLAEYTACITTPAEVNGKPPPAAGEPHITLPATGASHLLFILGLIEDWLQDASQETRAELSDYLAGTVTPVSSPGHLLYQIDAITRQLTG